MARMNVRQLLMLLSLAALWGMSFLFIAEAVPALGPVGLADARVALAALVLAAVAAGRGALPRVRERPRDWLFVAFFNIALPFTLIGAAQLTIPASLAAIVNATTPMWAVLVGAIALGDRLDARVAAGLAAGVAGVALVVGLSPVEGGLTTVLAVSASLGAALCYAIGSHYVGARMGGIAPTALSVGQLAVAAVLLLPFLAVIPPRDAPDGGEVLALLGLALPCTAVAYLLYFRLIAETGATSTLTVTYLVPVFGVLWATIFRGEQITAGMIAGAALVLAGVLLVSRRPRAGVTGRSGPPSGSGARSPLEGAPPPRS